MLTGARDKTCKRTVDPGAQLPLYQIARTTEASKSGSGADYVLPGSQHRRQKQATKVRTPTAEKRTHTERGRATRPDLARTQRTVSGHERATRERAVDWQAAELLDEHTKVPGHSRPLAQPI
jgi:hypothetical protein